MGYISDLLTKRGIYIYGNTGVGKTSFVYDILKKKDYDIIHFDAGDVRNKSAIDKITKHNMSDKNIMLDRKILSDLAISDNATFKKVVKKAIS